ncbi:MAG: M20 family metallopeptidase [Bacteroidales bacterium]|jgi:amidohydrolase
MSTLDKYFLGSAERMLPRLIEVRRHLHRYPELSEQEHATMLYLSQWLEELGIKHQKGVAGTGIVARIEGEKKGNSCVALRADMDALPIEEKNETDYVSLNPGVMHACGHDAHMASLLGAMMILQENRHAFGGTIKCIFQPSEEKYPGGAIRMIGEGVLKDPEPAAIFGQHVYPDLPAGKVGFKTGKYMASTDEIYITVKGKGGHAASPHQNVDPIVIGSEIILALQQVVSRRANPTMPTVLSFGRFMAQGRTNIIPEEARLEGTLRTFDEQWRAEAHSLIQQIATGIASAHGASIDVFIDRGYPFVFNDEALTQRAMNVARRLLGSENVLELDLRMTAEDFAYYGQYVPACFYRLGTALPFREFTPLHSAQFDIDESALLTGSSLMALLAVEELNFRSSVE